MTTVRFEIPDDYWVCPSVWLSNCLVRPGAPGPMLEPKFGWVAFGGNVREDSQVVKVTPPRLVPNARISSAGGLVAYSARGKGSFDVLVDGKKVGEQSTERRSPEQDVRFFDVEYAISSELIQGKQKVAVRFEAAAVSDIPGVFGIRTVRVDQPH